MSVDIMQIKKRNERNHRTVDGSRPHQIPKPRKGGIIQAIINTPPPPCSDPSMGSPCAFLAQCTKTGTICRAFDDYANLRPYRAEDRHSPYGHISEFKDRYVDKRLSNLNQIAIVSL